ncbi:Uncharacterised protein [Vibrio cholerae]|nr:Uncharacterised protein [Vibrio cholerae]
MNFNQYCRSFTSLRAKQLYAVVKIDIVQFR